MQEPVLRQERETSNIRYSAFEKILVQYILHEDTYLQEKKWNVYSDLLRMSSRKQFVYVGGNIN
jgi:hypothetical protein